MKKVIISENEKLYSSSFSILFLIRFLFFLRAYVQFLIFLSFSFSLSQKKKQFFQLLSR